MECSTIKSLVVVAIKVPALPVPSSWPTMESRNYNVGNRQQIVYEAIAEATPASPPSHVWEEPEERFWEEPEERFAEVAPLVAVLPPVHAEDWMANDELDPHEVFEKENPEEQEYRDEYVSDSEEDRPEV